MKIEASIEQFIGDILPPQILVKPLPDEVAEVVINRLKHEADRYWYIDPHRSLELAERIVIIGQRRGDTRQTALG
ncbi:MAG TPA: hypothetical protein VF918_13295, partial [Anaerolineales bacterium]